MHYSANLKENKSGTLISKVMFTLALTLLPTVFGIHVGMGQEFGVAIAKMGVLYPILCFVAMLGVIFAINKLKDSTGGFVLLFGFTFLMGLMISGVIGYYLSTPQGVSIIMQALIMTISISVFMGIIGAKTTRDLSKLRAVLFFSLIAIIVAMIINLFVASTMLSLVVSVIAAVIFSLYILSDVNLIANNPEIPVTSATLMLYLNIINLFMHLLQIIGFGADD